MKILFVLALCLAIVMAKPAEDLVKEVPDMGKFDQFDFYSGYLDIPNKQRKLHYVFAESQNDPANDPLVIWFNGGPGCSSMLGFVQEHGPYSMPDGEDTFYENPYSWNTEANMLYIESPAGVGYSYYWGDDNGESDDLASSEENYAALESFYQKFPEFLDNDLFITGESYAGIYVPYLAWQVLEHGKKYNLKGIIVGNGVANRTFMDGAFEGMGFWHNLYSLKMFDDILDNHCDFANIDIMEDGEEDTEKCEKLEKEFGELISSLNPYDVYRECYKSDSKDRLGSTIIDGKVKTYKRGMTAQEYTPFFFEGKGKTALGHVPPCVYASGTTDYLNRKDVREALHITTDQPWEICVGGERIFYTTGAKQSHWIYPILKDQNIRVLQFSGNADGVVPTQFTRDWIHSYGWPKVRDTAPFFAENDSKVGGYVEYYDGMTFATIIGVGHMAAQWSPAATKHAVYQFLKNEPIDQ
eukprot:CAMPEP_0196995206 /NCGR_PEP_ID=MMETSP1380-20130617/1373_1 /TAXON_ID=5936 /ORGANISM="Euplotes crassus, Strain CT5" /LENGTH=468 /DNA_ID=CAMNT_0042410819 /DNA_START=13 /DNA_END=1419 /DNA_ORIENTATION=-